MTGLGWGIVGAGRIAGVFARQLADSDAGSCVAVGSRAQAKADEFGARNGVPECYGSYEALFDDPQVDVVYVATPHPFHAESAIRALEAGKHVLCEKPITLNFAQAEAVVEAARIHGRFLMEAFMYRCHPQTARLVELIGSGAIGDVQVIQATHSYRTAFQARSRLFSPELGGGGILDVGGYPISMSRLVAGAVAGLPFAEPVDVAGYGRLGPTGVDEYAVGVLRFDGDVVAQVASGIRTSQGGPMVRVSGSEGEVLVPEPWTCGDRDNKPARSTIVLRSPGRVEEIAIEPARGRYAFEAEHVARCIGDGLLESPLMSWSDSLGNMSSLDRWREAIGLRYPDEEPERVPTVTRRPLARRRSVIASGQIPGVDLPVSRLVLGRGVDTNLRATAPLIDAFFESGGNCLDTAFNYDGGQRDVSIGQWLTNRGVRSEVVILAKGAHTPNCNPAGVDREIRVSLDRLKTDYVDIYMLHRDNAQVDVGEFVDVLNRHVDAGRIRAIGVSNWCIERIEQANAWADARGLRRFVAVSNQFSLAQPCVDQIWGGTVNAGDPESRAWFERTQTALLAWSSQAQGFFVRADSSDRSDRHMVRCWHGDDNFERLRRSRVLGAEKGVAPVNIALAWVLAQGFPTFPLIGPRNLRELNSSIRAFEVRLTPEEVLWLDLASTRRASESTSAEGPDPGNPVAPAVKGA
jgi:predicted dehydrogenase/aryl-alcohol dehydrogenase-like predicted oxidoreductase